jgi:hypothetical protein
MATTSQAASDGWPTPSRACQACAPFVIDGELVACDDAGLPDLCALNFHTRDRGLCIWEFDHFHHNCPRQRGLARRSFEKLVLAANANWLRSESFHDGVKLLIAAYRMKLEAMCIESPRYALSRQQKI